MRFGEPRARRRRASALRAREALDLLEVTRDVLARTQLLVRATDFDGDANTVKEAMMLGVPVLATDLPNRPPGIDLVARDALGTLGPRIAALLDAPDPAALARNRAFVREDIERNAAAIFGLYAEVRRA